MTHYLRKISTTSLTLYGLGAILGAGIYALVGKVAYFAGLTTPLSFLLSGLTASFTAFSYAELSSRIPRSGGEVAYIRTAFASVSLGNFVGWLVILTGIISTSTMATAIVGYIHEIDPEISRNMIIFVFIVIMALVAAKGIEESMALVVLITIIETGALVFVISVGFNQLNLFSNLSDYLVPAPYMKDWEGVMSGAFLAFYAFIGFEDIVNVADEVINPQVTIPKAIVYSLGLATVIYGLVSLVLIKSLPIEQLSASTAPMAQFFSQHTQISPVYISIISIIAISNGALIQLIMAARIMHAIACHGGAPKMFAHINKYTNTPLMTTIAVALVMLIFAIFLPLTFLAQLTSLVILLVFSLVNLSLLIMKIRYHRFTPGKVSYSPLIPLLGCISCGFLLMSQTINLAHFKAWLI